MNELEVLEGFRADAPEPDESWLRELRGRITTRSERADHGPERCVSKRLATGSTRDERAAAL